MSLTDEARIAVLENEVAGLKGAINGMAADVRVIRDVMLTDAGKRKGSWKTLTVAGAVVLGLASFWSDVGDLVRKIFA